MVSELFLRSGAAERAHGAEAPALLDPVGARDESRPVSAVQPTEVGVVLTIAVFGLYLAGVVRWAWLSDDAFISFRAIDNLKHGFGLVSNPPERVLGFTNPLWTLLVFLPYALFGQIYAVALSVSLVCSAAAAFHVARRSARAPLGAALALLLLALSGAYVEFSTGGLENPLAHLLLALFFTSLLRDGMRPREVRPWLLAALVTLNRMDHVLLVAPALMGLLLSAPLTAGTGLARLRALGVVRPLRPVARAALIGGVPLLLWISFAVVYYGFPYPNTAYAKLNVELPPRALASQGLWYLLESLQRDPLTLLVIAVGAATAVRERSRESLGVAAGLLLYVAYVVRVGGDFMSGRFLTAPLLVAVVWLAARVLSSLGEREMLSLAAVVGLLGVSFPGGLAARSAPDKGIPASGIVDERAWYQDSTGLMENVRIRKYEHGWQFKDARALRRKGVKVSVHPNVGLLGFAAGPGVTIVDGLALTDPLLARIPFRSNGDFRIGHFQRDLPAGYEETLRTGTNVIEDPCLHEYYDLLSRVVRGPLFTVARWRAIFGLNFGVHDSLVNGTCKR